MDSQIKAVCADFSAVTVDPLSGHLFIASEVSALVAEVALVRRGGKLTAQLVQSLPLRDGNGKPLRRVEGLAFDPAGNLHVLQENDRRLWRLERK
jgi:uncharacterized protein YjiK